VKNLNESKAEKLAQIEKQIEMQKKSTAGMTKKVAIEKSQMQQSNSEQYSEEVLEWQKIAKKEKSSVSMSSSVQQQSFVTTTTTNIAPIFTKSLEPVAVKENEAAKFRVEFEANPVPVVKWLRYTFPLKDSVEISIENDANSSTMIIRKTCVDDAGIFTCLIENPAGATKTSTNLIVMEETQQNNQISINKQQMTENSQQMTENSQQMTEKSQQMTENSQQMTENSQQMTENSQQQSSMIEQQEESLNSTSESCQKQSFISQTHVTSKSFSKQSTSQQSSSSTTEHIQNQQSSQQNQQEAVTTSKTMHVKKSDKIRIDIQFKDGSKSDLTFTHNGTPLTDSNQDGIEITFANDIATLTIANAEPKHSGMYQCIMKTEGGEAKCSVKCEVDE
jgi:hypothetical protein